MKESGVEKFDIFIGVFDAVNRRVTDRVVV